MRLIVAYCFYFMFGLSYLFGHDLTIGNKHDSFINVEVNNIDLKEDYLITNLYFDFSDINLKKNRQVVITPIIINGYHYKELTSITVAGRNRWHTIKRNHEENGLILKSWGKNRILNYEYSDSIPFEEWMFKATLILKYQVIGCTSCPKEDGEFAIAETFIQEDNYSTPDFIYVVPEEEQIKRREISARAYIDYPVNLTEIIPDFKRNPIELGKIKATLDSIRNDEDISVLSLHITGYASPEGEYDNNLRLAKGRTESLKNYVQKLSNFPLEIITTEYEASDWEGLENWLDNNRDNKNLRNISTILDIVKSNIDPKQKNYIIKNSYPKEYEWLLANVYPSLRHSDYKIEFEIKTYSLVSEIIEIMQTYPQKLSLSELFIVAESQPEGSELYDRAFELAVNLYPQNEIANINASIAAMQRNDMVSAKRYLARSGQSPEADYLRAVYSMIQKDYSTAKLIFGELIYSSEPVVAEQAQIILNEMANQDNKTSLAWKLIN